jgi:hypothetical protein
LLGDALGCSTKRIGKQSRYAKEVKASRSGDHVRMLLVVLAAAVGPDEGARWLLFVLRVDVKLLALVVHAERDDHNQVTANHSTERPDALL